MILSKGKIKLIRSLRLKKNRLAHDLMVMEGEKLICEAITRKQILTELFITEELLTKNPALFEHQDYTLVNKKDLKGISELKNNYTGLALLKLPKFNFEWSKIAQEKIIILDGVKDPGNLGTIIRMAEWYGIKSIICSQETVDFSNFKVVQSSMGSVFGVQIFYKDLAKFYESLPKYFPVLELDLKGENIRTLPPLKKGALVLGSESQGIQQSYSLAHKVKIPNAQNAQTESLNVAIACAIALERLAVEV